MRRLAILFLVCSIDFSICRPAEEPTRFTLNIGAEPVKNVDTEVTSGLDQGRELLGRIADAIRILQGRFVNSITLARNILINRAEMLTSESHNNVPSVARVKSSVSNEIPSSNYQTSTRGTIRLESEQEQGFLERPKSNPIGGVLESFLNPTPLVDGIKEREKYGNSGDRFIGIGRALVGGFEGFSNFLNAIVDFPSAALKKTSKGITAALNNVGARIVGLE